MNLELLPWKTAYEKMIEKSQEMTLPQTKEGQRRHLDIEFLEAFDEATVLEMKNILEKSEYIPQEIITLADLGDE